MNKFLYPALLFSLMGCGWWRHAPHISYTPAQTTPAEETDTLDNCTKLPADSLNQMCGAFEDTLTETAFGNVVADKCLADASEYLLNLYGMPCHAAVIPPGSIRTSLAGPILHIKDWCSALPLQNHRTSIIVLKLNGRQMDSLFYTLRNPDNWYVAGMNITYHHGAWLQARIQNQPFDSRRDYYIATTLGMPKLRFVPQEICKLPPMKTAHYLRDAVITGLQKEYAKDSINRVDSAPRILHGP
ncbi:MAG: 5'-nucleotidase C-terminal domain-containing protein [Bacteroidetes bacterium]|nr:5'-nucleotidase C-terminal domain-containing protein [Bacteroidota bacterium]